MVARAWATGCDATQRPSFASGWRSRSGKIHFHLGRPEMESALGAPYEHPVGAEAGGGFSAGGGGRSTNKASSSIPMIVFASQSREASIDTFHHVRLRSAWRAEFVTDDDERADRALRVACRERPDCFPILCLMETDER